VTRQQKWAQSAFVAVQKQAKSTLEKKYGTYCMKLPSLLLQSGLVQTTAYLRSRGEDAAVQFLNDVAATLRESKSTGKELDEQARKAPLSEYLRLSRDALQVATWFRRFAQTELEVDVEGGTDARTP